MGDGAHTHPTPTDLTGLAMTTTMTATTPAATGHPAYSATHPTEEQTAGIARTLVRDALDAWDLDALADCGELIISELVTNAIKHTPCRHIRITVDRPTPSRVRLAVIDRAPHRLPAMRTRDPDRESGHGLLLVDTFADCWGYDLLGSNPSRGPWGKRVWAELKVDRP